MGMSPFEAPATFSLMPYTELAHGVWYPIGGMYRVVERLTDLARLAGVDLDRDDVLVLEKSHQPGRGLVRQLAVLGGVLRRGHRRQVAVAVFFRNNFV